MTLNVLSYGGGVQSTAILVLAKNGMVNLDAAIFVEIDTENPATINYVRDFAEPFCQQAGIKFIRINISLTRMIEESPDFPPVPFRDASGKLFGRRQCTNHAKIRPFRRALRALMKMNGEKRANVLLGISADEAERMRDSDIRYIKHIYPLVDLNLNRAMCAKIIDAELPVPQKSSCWFCPFASKQFQRNVLRNYPHLEAEAARLQDKIDEARRRTGADRLTVIRFDPEQRELFGDMCGGMCHT